MISQDRDQLRRYYLRCWQKQQNGETLAGLEQQVAEVIAEHPEYHAELNHAEGVVQKDYNDGEEGNPFLHMSLHLGLREQVVTDRPEGIRNIYQQMIGRHGVHQAEHLMMQALAESLWLAQQNGTPPDEEVYRDRLKQLI